MRRAVFLAALLLAACSSSDPTGTDPQIPTSIIITPGLATMRIGDELTMTASLRDQAGLPIEEHEEIRWSSDAPTIAGVDALSGHVTAYRAGMAIIEARYGTMTRNAPVTVLAPLAFGFSAIAEKTTPGRNGAPYVCTVALLAGTHGGAPGEYGVWQSATVEIRRSTGVWSNVSFGGSGIADWFGTDRLYAGESRAGRMTISDAEPFDLAIYLRMSLPDGSIGSDNDVVDCF